MNIESNELKSTNGLSKFKLLKTQKSKFWGRTFPKKGLNIIELFLQAILPKGRYKGIFAPNLKKIGQTFGLIECGYLNTSIKSHHKTIIIDYMSRSTLT